MAGSSSKSKGKRGEYEGRDLVQGWLTPVYAELGLVPPVLQRNVEQVRGGGFDIVGLDWLALEIKRQEKAQLPAWWSQTLRQTRPGQVPVLMWRQNRSPWAFRIRVRCLCGDPDLRMGVQEITADLSLPEAHLWFRQEIFWRAQIGVALT
jgi:hypothetical protein